MSDVPPSYPPPPPPPGSGDFPPPGGGGYPPGGGGYPPPGDGGYPPPGGGGYPPPGDGGYPPPGSGGYPSATPLGPGGLPLAEWWQRLVAIIIDGFIVGAAGAIVSAILPGLFFRLLVQAVLGGAYYAYLNGEKGQTVGKMVMKLKTVDAATGNLIGLNAGIMRALIYPVGATFTCGILAIVDGVMIFTDPARMSLHDKVAKSQVVVVGQL